jgi:hypothetical protein
MWEILAHTHIKNEHYYTETNATEFLSQVHIELLENFQPNLVNKNSELPQGKVLLQAGTLSGGRYIVGRLIECGYTLYAIPSNIVKVLPNHESSKINFECL